MASDLDKVILDGISSWFQNKSVGQAIMNQNGANLVYASGQHKAKLLGIDGTPMTYFPPNTTVQVQAPPQRSRVKDALLYTGLAATLMASGALGYHFFNQPQPQPTNQSDANVGFTIE